jgi:hypothetical protein
MATEDEGKRLIGAASVVGVQSSKTIPSRQK